MKIKPHHVRLLVVALFSALMTIAGYNLYNSNAAKHGFVASNYSDPEFQGSKNRAGHNSDELGQPAAEIYAGHGYPLDTVLPNAVPWHWIGAAETSPMQSLMAWMSRVAAGD